MSRGITVKELLDTEYLKDICRVVAGEKGLHKKVSWVHILEMRDAVTECVDGEELILTTGIGFNEDNDVAVSFVKGLIEKNVTALCIETVFYYKNIDDKLIELANLYDFPLIEIHTISRFVDISKGVNTLLLNQNNLLYGDADKYDAEIERLDMKSVEELISFTAEYINLDISLKYADGKQISNRVFSANPRYINVKPILFLGVRIGELTFGKVNTPLSDYDLLIQARLIIHIRQILEKKQYELTERLKKSSIWTAKWLDGNLSDEQVRVFLKKMGMTGSFCGAIVCTLRMTKEQRIRALCKDNKENGIEYNLIENSNFGIAFMMNKHLENAGITGIPFVTDSSISFILFNNDKSSVVAKAEKAIESLVKNSMMFLDLTSKVFCFGKMAESFADVERSYTTSIELMLDTEEHQGQQRCVYYDRLYLKRLLKVLYKQDVLEDYCKDYLGELLLKKNESLFLTLNTYFKNNCSKQETAECLFVSRQTLYHRIEKLRDILGDDFDRGERRLSIEVAVKAKEYMDEMK